eukprot:1466877-Rhodomonas_salina.2
MAISAQAEAVAGRVLPYRMTVPAYALAMRSPAMGLPGSAVQKLLGAGGVVPVTLSAYAILCDARY